ncbi:MAG: MFS transporter [Muribaculaceae bacterium]|nr:MFS transporter [Muribaculaceae bacterium]MDE6299371.1 MFS transporter [Muribaculaceae bacterium]
MVEKSQQEKRNFALPITIMFALFFMIAFVTGYQNPLGSVIEKMSDGNKLMSQLGTFANFIAYAFMGYPAGILLQNKGFRITAIWAVTIGFVGVAITYGSGFIADDTTAVVIYLVGAFVAGFSMCLLNSVVNPLLNSLGSTPKQGNQLVQFGGAFNSLGATLAPVIVGGMLGGAASTISSANPVFYLAMAIFAIAFVVLYFSKLPEATDLGQKKEKIKVAKAFAFTNFTFGVLAIFCYVGLEVGIANWTLQYLEKSPDVISNNVMESAAIAGTVVGIYWLLMLIGRLLGGVIGGKISSRLMLTVAAVGAMALLIAGISSPEKIVDFIGFSSADFTFGIVKIPMNAVFFVLCGFFASVMWGAIFNLSVTGLGKYTAVASGIFMVMVCGGGVFPAIQSLIASNSIIASFWVPFCLAAYICIYALFLSRPKNTEGMPEEPEVLN